MEVFLALAAAMTAASVPPSKSDWPGYKQCVEIVSEGLAETRSKESAREIASLTIDFCEDAARFEEGGGGLYSAAVKTNQENSVISVIDAYAVLREVADKVRSESVDELAETISRHWPRSPTNGD